MAERWHINAINKLHCHMLSMIGASFSRFMIQTYSLPLPPNWCSCTKKAHTLHSRNGRGGRADDFGRKRGFKSPFPLHKPPMPPWVFLNEACGTTTIVPISHFICLADLPWNGCEFICVTKRASHWHPCTSAHPMPHYICLGPPSLPGAAKAFLQAIPISDL